MRHKPIDTITAEDIRALVDGQVREDRHLDYKEKLPGNADSEKKEFLADVVAFANSGGGDIVYGIGENRDASGNTGLPVLKGLPKDGLDKERLRLEQMIQTGIAPRVPGISFKEVDMGEQGVVLVLRIPASWAGPHMISLGRSSHFYARNSAGKYPLDVTEIRSAFNASEGVVQRVRQFRVDRIAKILGNDMRAPLGDKSCCVLHVVSLAGRAPGSAPLQLDGSIQRDHNSLLSPTADHYGFGLNWNLDGIFAYEGAQTPEEAYAVLTLFRTGAVESVDSTVFGDRQVFPYALEKNVLGRLSRHYQLLGVAGATGPVAVSMSLLNVNGFAFTFPNSFPSRVPRSIDRPVLLFPELVLDEAPNTANLRPLFDLFWQSAGYERSMSYNESGEYVQR